MKYLIAIAWITLICAIGYIPNQDDFILLIGLYASLFVLYLITYRVFRAHNEVLFFIFLSILLRLCLIFAFPNLSDDIYRFLWDGYLINDHVNPYLYTPTEWLAQSKNGAAYNLLYDRLNSPDYYSVYPPVCQFIFAGCVKVFPGSIYWATVLMKVIFVAAETCTLYLLLKLVQLEGLPISRVLLYSLNPLIIVELTGNLHFEAIMILGLVASFWFFVRKRYKLFGIFMALSIGAKLLPIMFLPFIVRRVPLRSLIISLLVLLMTIIAMFWPFVNAELIAHFGESLNLYFQKFEFNASTYYVLRWIGFKTHGYNLIQSIGPSLSMMTFFIIATLALFEKKLDQVTYYNSLLLAFSTYLWLATTIHPWYLAIPVLLSIFTYFRYPIFWSGLICLTYINYMHEVYYENLWIVGFEYVVLITLLTIELFRLPVAKMVIDGFEFFWSKWGKSEPSKKPL